MRQFLCGQVGLEVPIFGQGFVYIGAGVPVGFGGVASRNNRGLLPNRPELD